jgi:hypothetical protein
MNGQRQRKQPTKKSMEAAAIHATSLAHQGAAYVQQLLLERVKMDDAVNKLLEKIGTIPDIDDQVEAIFDLRKERLQV